MTPREGGLASRARELGALPWVTAAAMILLAAVFAAELARGVDAWRPSAGELARIGASPAADGVWRFALAPLVHLGVLHLAFNLAGLALVGPPLERALGRVATALVLAGGALFGSAIHVIVDPYGLSIGASGATFAAAGALAIVVTRTRARSRADALRLGAFALANAIAFALHAIGSIGARPDLDAHAAGAAVGLAVAIAAGARPTLLRTGVLTATLAAAIAIVLAVAPPAIDWRADLERAARLERRFDDIVPETLSGPAPELARRVEAEVIAPLAALRDGLRDDERLPAAIASRRAALRAYLDARLRGFRAVVRYLDTGDPSVRADFDAANRDADRALAAP